MDRLKRERTPLRASVTKIVNELEAGLGPDQDVDALRLKRSKLERKMTQLRELDEKVKDTLLDDDAVEAEYQDEQDTVDDYEDKVASIMFKVERAIKPQSRPNSLVASEFDTAVSAIEQKTRSYKLPKIELKKFNGELKEWLSFWSQFKKIHEAEDLHATDKFQYLVQSMVAGSSSSEFVKSYPQTAENYPKVVSALEERFGKKELLIEVYTRELSKLVISSATSRDKLKLSELYDKLVSKLRALESLREDGADSNVVMLHPFVESSLPEEVLTAWQRSPLSEQDGAQEYPPKGKLDYLMEFLKKEVARETHTSIVRDGYAEPKKESKVRPKVVNHQSKSDIPTAAGLFVGNSNSKSCVFCDKSHPSQECGKARGLTLYEKRAKMKEKRACFRCIRTGHGAGKCPTYVQCHICNQDHYTLMCPTGNKKTEIKESFHKTEETKLASANLSCSSDVLLKTLLVRMEGDGVHHVARLLFDDGSQHTYVKEATAKFLKCKLLGQENMQKSLFGGAITEVRVHKKYSLKLESLDGKNSREIMALDEPVVCGNLPRIPMGPWIKELKRKKIWLSDFVSDSPEIEILVGSDYWGGLMTGKTVKLQCGLIAMETVFGWTLSGTVPKQKSAAMTVTSALFVSDASIEDLWNMETIGIRDPIEVKTKEEQESAAKQKFMETVSRNLEGRFSVALPWNDGKQLIPDNRRIAEKRLMSATAKLHIQGKFKEYGNIFDSWVSEGIIEQVKERDANNPSHYLPHRPVFKPESRTTPIRPVFDASYKTGRSPSLNDCLYKGPNLLELIPCLLLKFRAKRVGVIADIRKAFQMIEVQQEDRDFQRFLWWEDYEKKTFKIYRHKRVVFGINCSPFLLAAVLEHHIARAKAEDKHIADQLIKSLYVDNCVTSVDTLEEYELFKETSTRIMEDAKMDLRQWERTIVEVPGVGQLLNSRSGLGNGISGVLSCERFQEEWTSVLGLRWNKATDILCCDIKLQEIPEKITKRVVLSIVQQVYDPIGFTCPAMIVPKLILQKTWEDSKGWDEDLPTEEKTKFVQWCQELNYLQQLQIPRNISGGVSSAKAWQLHTFSDASQNAYAAVVFLRTESGEEVSVQLLQAKARVAPLKKTTIPRLELLGCVIAARLLSSVKKGLNLTEIPTYFWSDSTTALAWIRRNDDWGTFVGNRIKEICQLSDVEDWRHVPGVLNPADLPSRGCSSRELVDSRWWEGPDWLRKDVSEWPCGDEIADEAIISQERKKSSNIAIAIEEVDSWYKPKFSSYSKNVTVMAWIRRFISNLKLKKRQRDFTRVISVQELRKAEKEIVKIIQKESFPSGVTSIKNVNIVERNELLRVKTRLLFREDTEEFRWPALLPNSHPLVEQLIREVHRTYCHAGAQFVLGKLRESFWILQGRKAVRNVIHRCARCRRFDSKPLEVGPAALPEKRVRGGEVFQTTGIDLAGPLFIKEGKTKGTTKVWIVLYTCAVYRCIYLDVVDSLSTDAFINSLERFINTYGRPDTIFSDNGTNFVGCANLFKKLDWTRIERVSRAKQIQWMFNPPTAAWWGGWWERLIRSVKDLLRRILDKSKLTLDELRTCLSSVSATINERPLTTLTEDPKDLSPLTPAMFLRGTRNATFPEGVKIKSSELQSQYKRMKAIQKTLEQRFRREYLAQLVQRATEKKTPVPKVGDIVLVGADNKKRFEWPMGRIIELIPGKDDKIRVAKVRTERGMLLRPLQRLYPLEVANVTEIMGKEILHEHVVVFFFQRDFSFSTSNRKIIAGNVTFYSLVT